MDCSPPASSVHGILQGRVLKWLAIPFCRESSRTREQILVSGIAGRFFIVWAIKEAHLSVAIKKVTWLNCIELNTCAHTHTQMNACKTKVSGLLQFHGCDAVLFVVVLVTTLSPTPPAVLCSLKDCSPPGSSVHGILQDSYWSGLPFPIQGLNVRLLHWHVNSLPTSHLGSPLVL